MIESVTDFLGMFKGENGSPVYKIEGKLSRSENIIILDAVRKGYAYTYDEITYKLTDTGMEFLKIKKGQHAVA
jgi:hypothetical protein